MTASQLDKAIRFRDLHQRAGTLLIGNAWDARSARILETLGFEAIATSSGAASEMLALRDGQMTRDQSLGQAWAIVAATALPVSADLENGFGDAPEEVAETIRQAAAAGLVGCSIEDGTRDPQRPRYDLSQAVDRVAAAVQAARALDFPFTLTARCENFIRNHPDLEDTVARLQAFERAGADVLMAPGLPDLDAVRAVCQALSRPVNFMAGIRGKSFSVAELQAAGVKRISVASTLYRAAMSGLITAACEVKEQGTFGYLEQLSTLPG